ncbi:hypothetical protein KBD49_05230 [Myxococcota bacterium]|nr:hypothetical protein [Myxococcota bacterium]
MPNRPPEIPLPGSRFLDDLVRDLFSPLFAPGALPAGWEAVTWESEQGPSLTLRNGDRILVVELERPDDRRPFHARTRWFDVTLWWPFGSRPLDAAGLEMLERVVQRVLAFEASFEKPDRLTISRQSLVRSVKVDRVLIPEGLGQYYVNPYSGCLIGCDFCFVAERADWARELEGLPALPWGRWLDVKVNAPQVLAEEVGRYPPGPVRFSPVLTDPYQPAERRFGITRGCLEVLAGTGFAPMILTRASLVLRDLDLFRRFRRIAVGFSIPTDDDRMRALFEPGADPIEDRLEALETLHREGITTFVVIQPMLPMDPMGLVSRLAPMVRAARIDRMHALHRVAPLYRQHRLEFAMTDSFAQETREILVREFRRHGVSLDEMDDMTLLMGD